MKLKKFIKNAQSDWSSSGGTGTGIMGPETGSLGFGTPGGGGSGLGQRINLPPSHQGHPGNLAPGPWSGDSISDESLKSEVFNKKIGDYTVKELMDQIRSLMKINTPESRSKVMFLKQVLDDKMRRMKAARRIYDAHIITKNAALISQLKNDSFVQSLFQEHDVPLDRLDEVSNLPEELTHFALHNLVHRIIVAGLEEKIPILSKKYDISEEEVRSLANYDPTNTKSYLDWIIRHKQELRDQQHTQDVLKVFEKAKKSQALTKKDINQYKTFDELETTLHSIPEDQLETTRGKERKQTETGQKVVYNKSPYKVLEITTPEAMSHLARNTKWCVKDPKFFNEYKPPFYMVLKNGQPYVLIHRPSDQIKDVEDEEVGEEALDELVSIFKVIFNIEHPALITPQKAFSYAQVVIKGRWPEAEEIIKESPEMAYFYAQDVVKGRWPEAEEIIKESPEVAYSYARDVIKDRWPEAEEIIMQDPDAAEMYNREFLVTALNIKHFTKTAQTAPPVKGECPESGKVKYVSQADLVEHDFKVDCPEGKKYLVNMKPVSILEYKKHKDKKKRRKKAQQEGVRLEKLDTVGDVEVWLADGRLVREKYFIDFTQGGNHERYNWIPDNEIWIDDDMSLDERSFIIVHEFLERYLMREGNMSYDEAHKHADELEEYLRIHSPEFNGIEKEAQVQSQLVFTEKEKGIIEKVREAAEELDINTFLVGGAVRDKLLGKEEVDMDFVCEKGAEKIVAYLAQKYGTQVPVQYSRSQAIMITVDEVPLDFINAEMLFRPLKMDRPLEGEEEFTFSFDDAYRRDLTINTLMYDIRNNKLLDPTGKGLDDLRKGVINTVIDPFIKFKIHAADMLRALRFATVLGFELGPDMIEAMKANAERIVPRDKGGDISNRRIRRELRKAIDTPQHWAKMRELLQQAGLDIILDEDIQDVQTDFKGGIEYHFNETPKMQVKEASSDNIYEIWMNDTVLYAKTDFEDKANSLLKMLKDKGHQAFIKVVEKDEKVSFTRIKNFVKIAGIFDIFKEKKETVPFGATSGAERYDYLAQKLDAILAQSPIGNHQQVVNKFLSDYPQLPSDGKAEIMSKLQNFKIVAPKDKKTTKEIRWGK